MTSTANPWTAIAPPVSTPSTGDNPPPDPPEDQSGDGSDEHHEDESGSDRPRYFYPKTRERLPVGELIQPGQRLYCGLHGGRYGIVFRITGEQSPGTVRELGGVACGGRATICAVFESGTKSEYVPESVVRGVQWEIYNSVATPEEIMDAIDYCAACEARRQQEAKDKAAKDAEQLAADMAADGLAWMTADEIAAKGKACGAKRVIWAELDEDVSDSMSDYHNHHTTRRVVIGFSTSSRESFPALRKAAALFGPTSDMGPGKDRWTVSAYRATPDPRQYQDKEELRDEQYNRATFSTKAEAEAFIANLIATAPECQPDYVGCVGFPHFAKNYGVEYFEASFEHRENWSMGGGNFLKDGHRDSDGWKVSSDPIEYLKGTERVQYFEPKAKAAEPKQVATATETNTTPPPSASGVTVTTNTVKGGIEIRFPSKPAADVLDGLKAHGWRWSRFSSCWYNRDTPTARAYAEGIAGTPAAEPQTVSKPATEPAASKPIAQPAGVAIAEKLRDKADALTKKIEHLTRPLSQNPTPKRVSELQSRTCEGDRLRRVQTAFRALADLWERGECPPLLADIRNVNEAETLLRTKIQHVSHYHILDTGDYTDTTPKGKALQELAEDPDALARKRARLLQSEIDKLRFCDIPGFFPTPPEVCRQVIELAEIDDTHGVLEPSAGIGSLADACPVPRNVDCVEQWSTLRDILSMKGYRVTGRDFMECDPLVNLPFDRVVMNPPFENGQDARHVRHAFEFLKPGGRLVAIVSAGILQRSDRTATDFREWLAEVNADQHDLPEDAFNGKDAFCRTGTRAVILVIDKPAE